MLYLVLNQNIVQMFDNFKKSNTNVVIILVKFTNTPSFKVTLKRQYD